MNFPSPSSSSPECIQIDYVAIALDGLMSANQDQPTINMSQRKWQLSGPKLALIARAAVFDCKPLRLQDYMTCEQPRRQRLC